MNLRKPECIHSLTPREFETVKLLTVGLTYKEAGDKMGVSAKTVEKHWYNSKYKTNWRRIIDATHTMLRLGKIDFIA